MQRRDLIHPRDEILRAIGRIYRYRMTTTSGGNLSIRDDDGSIWITPARVDKGSLRRDDIIRVRPDGTAEGPHKPSSEFPFHRAIYEARTDLRAVVHAHPVALVAFSISGRVPDTRILPQAWRVCGRVGFAPYALPGSEALGRSIAATFAGGFNAILLENHGVATGGATLQEAFERFETLEFAAKTIIKAGQLGEVRTLDEADAARTRPEVSWTPRARPSATPSREKDLRRDLCEFVRRAYRHRLMISTEGAFSARLDGDAFLITHHRVDRQALDLDDVVLVDGDSTEPGKVPSSSAANHRAIYRAHPGIEAIVFAYPVNATAFGLTGATLDARTIPESYLFLREVARAPFASTLGDGSDLARLVSPRSPVLLLENDGVLACGTSVLDAFDRLEVLESTAEAMIAGLALGGGSIRPMTAGVIEELRDAFKME